jgi:hypothetical protein
MVSQSVAPPKHADLMGSGRVTYPPWTGVGGRFKFQGITVLTIFCYWSPRHVLKFDPLRLIANLIVSALVTSSVCFRPSSESLFYRLSFLSIVLDTFTVSDKTDGKLAVYCAPKKELCVLGRVLTIHYKQQQMKVILDGTGAARKGVSPPAVSRQARYFSGVRATLSSPCILNGALVKILAANSRPVK